MNQNNTVSDLEALEEKCIRQWALDDKEQAQLNDLISKSLIEELEKLAQQSNAWRDPTNAINERIKTLKLGGKL